MNLDPHGLQPFVVDLHKFIQERPDRAKQQRPEKDDILYFPPHVVPTTYKFKNGKKKVDRPTNLAKVLNDTTCLENGFSVMSNGSKPSRAKFADGTPKHHKYTVRCCGVGRIGRTNPDKKQKRETKGATTSSDKCRYELPVFHDVKTNRLFVRANSGVNFQHNGHDFVPREHTKDSLSNIPRKSLDFAITLLEKNMPNNIVNAILETQSGRSLTSDSLKQLRNVVLNKKHQKTKGESAADTLKRIMDTTDGCNYICMTGSVNEARQRVRVHKYHVTKKEKKKDKQTNAEIRKREVQKDEELNEEMKEKVDVVDAEPNSEMEKYVLSVVKALTLKDGEVLLGIAWSTKEGRLAHMRFPDILGADVTFGDNNEKRPHIRLFCKSQRNNSLPLVDAFLPSQQGYVFSWFFEEAIPALLDTEALLKTQIILTDQCPIMCPTLTNPISVLKLYGKAIHRICKWHKVCVMCHF